MNKRNMRGFNYDLINFQIYDNYNFMDMWSKSITKNLLNKKVLFRGKRYVFKGLFGIFGSSWLPEGSEAFSVFLEPIDSENKSEEIKRLLKIDTTITFNLSYNQIQTEIKESK